MAGEITVHQLASHWPSLGMALLGRFCQNSNNILAKRSRFCYAHPLKIKLNEERWLMNCPHCAAITTRKRTKKTKLGYTTFFCPHCHCTFNERTGTPFNSLEFPTDIVLLAVLWRLRYKLSLRDLADTNLHSKPQL